MEAPAEFVWQGSYFDGRTATRHPVGVRVLREGLAFTTGEGTVHLWPFDRISHPGSAHPRDPAQFEFGQDPVEVLVVPDSTILAAIRETAPDVLRRFRRPARRRRMVLGTAGAIIAIIAIAAALYGWGIPALVEVTAARTPVAWEEKLGETVMVTLAPEPLRCTDSGPQRSLDTLMATLAAQTPDSPYRYRIFLVKLDVPNAFAAPGGYLAVTTGIIEVMDRPDELAGVLAHEMQHVVQRHATKLLLREVSLQTLLRMASGDLGGLNSTLRMAHTLGRFRYQRDEESAADRGAVAMLATARIDPRGMVTLLEKLQRSPAGRLAPPAYLSTHPDLDARITTLKDLIAQTRVPSPRATLPDHVWRELKAACRR